jgi:biopolymer transport protein ExbD
MKKRAILFAGVIFCFISCGRIRNKDSASMDNGQMTCLLLGYDSVIYYTGSSTQIQDVNRGKVTDTTFISAMFKKIRADDLTMALKPGDGGEVMTNLQEMVDFANRYALTRLKVDSIDSNEEKAFGVGTPPQIIAMLQSKPLDFKLNLPKDEPNTPNAVSNFPKASQLVILISGRSDIYAYMGGDIGKGKNYTYQELTDLLKAKRADKNFSVVIKPAKSTTYKNTVDMLDAMTISKIKHYALIDITAEEENYLNRLYQ